MLTLGQNLRAPLAPIPLEVVNASIPKKKHNSKSSWSKHVIDEEEETISEEKGQDCTHLSPIPYHVSNT